MLNRGIGRQAIFDDGRDYPAFARLLAAALGLLHNLCTRARPRMNPKGMGRPAREMLDVPTGRMSLLAAQHNIAELPLSEWHFVFRRA